MLVRVCTSVNQASRQIEFVLCLKAIPFWTRLFSLMCELRGNKLCWRKKREKLSLPNQFNIVVGSNFCRVEPNKNFRFRKRFLFGEKSINSGFAKYYVGRMYEKSFDVFTGFWSLLVFVFTREWLFSFIKKVVKNYYTYFW